MSTSYMRSTTNPFLGKMERSHWLYRDPDHVLKHLGGGQPPSFPWHARPQSHEIQDLNSNLGFSKEFCDPCLSHDTIWRPGQEMKVYVDNINM